MSELEAIKEIIQMIGGGGSLVVVLFMAYKMGYIRIGKNGNGKNGNGHSSSEPPTWAKELQEHFNHETTTLLREIRDTQKEGNEKMEKMNENIIYIKARLNGKS